MKNSKIFLVACMVNMISMGVVTIFAEVKSRNLELDAVIVPSRTSTPISMLDGEFGGGTDGYIWFIRFRNGGKEKIRFPKGFPRDSSISYHITSSGKYDVTLCVIWGMIKVGGGYRNVHSASDLRIVELLPGEETEIRIKTEINCIGEINAFYVSYNVREEVADRFGVWSGEVVNQARIGR